MNTQRKIKSSIRNYSLGMIVPLFLIAEIHASANDVHQVIDICTSSQRVMKDYALIQMGITYHNPQKDMDETIKRMTGELEELEKHKVSKELHAEEEALHKEWSFIEAQLKVPPSKESALSLHHYINTFAKHCEVLAEHLALDTGNLAEHYVVLIARLNLDVQELAAIYVMKAWDAMEDEAYYGEVNEILADFSEAYSKLQTAKSAMVSDSVKGKLKIVKKDFMLFEFMATSKSGRYVPLLMAKKAEKIDAKVLEALALEESEVE